MRSTPNCNLLKVKFSPDSISAVNVDPTLIPYNVLITSVSPVSIPALVAHDNIKTLLPIEVIGIAFVPSTSVAPPANPGP